ncbi:hypothetical protein TIFTF001_030152 [Ficus carica]|uniref:Uncharacterized protein n=1 Tax=Ficus carica TaxID=3494 RepID=A0AA88J3C7_FICCA|nr:hypothetical protein TIFTF001_030152 [Ficus carica]
MERANLAIMQIGATNRSQKHLHHFVSHSFLPCKGLLVCLLRLKKVHWGDNFSLWKETGYADILPRHGYLTQGSPTDILASLLLGDEYSLDGFAQHGADRSQEALSQSSSPLNSKPHPTNCPNKIQKLLLNNSESKPSQIVVVPEDSTFHRRHASEVKDRTTTGIGVGGTKDDGRQ